jgi:HSP20 family molecular chaperone IbpA
MATTLVDPFAPWMRGLGQVLHNQGTVSAFVPPADLLIDDDGVTVYMDVPGLRPENLEIELENEILTVRGDRPLSDGVLTLRIPKPETMRPRKIEIKASANGARHELGAPA